MNGNKHILFLLAAALVIPYMWGCKTSPPPKPDIIIPDTPNDTTVIIDTPPIDTGEVVGPIDTIIEIPDIIKKDEYRIALILPFNADSLYTSISSYTIKDHTNDEEDKKNRKLLPKETQKSLEFYEGVLYALDSLSSMGMSFELNVYDSHHSTYKTAKVLAKPEMKDMDAIIGPMFNKEATQVAEFAKENEIPHLLPFSPATGITANNPYHIKLNPSIYTHCKRMVDYIVDSIPNANVLCVRRPSELEEQMEAAMLSEMQFIGANFDYDSKVVDFDNGERNFNLASYIEHGAANVVIVPSFSEAFVLDICRRLTQEEGWGKEVIVFGMPTWLELPSMRFDYLAGLDAHLTLPLIRKTEGEDQERFLDYFEDTYSQRATDWAYMGYDVAMFLGQSWDSYGVNFLEIPNAELVYEGFGMDIVLAPNTIEKQLGNSIRLEINYFENQHVNIVKFDGYDLKRVF